MEKAQTIIYLMRHGLTDYTIHQMLVDKKPAEQVYERDGERVLTEEGRAGVKKVGEYLRDFAPLAIFSSQLKRAVQTAEIIKEYAEIPGEITKKDFLQDFFYEIDGHKKESQAVAFLKSLTEKYPGEQVVVVSHLNPIMEIISELGFADEEISSWQDVKSYSKEPLKMSQGYRIVFAGDVPVECVKVNPAGV